jgi:hypothetical protein
MRLWTGCHKGLVPIALISFLFVTTSSCTRTMRLGLGSETQVYRPPTLAPTMPPATVTPIPSTGEASERDCTDALTFITDVTIPDGTAVEAGSTIDKRWEVKNSGTCNWDETYSVRLIGGPEMGASTEQALIPARSGSQVVIRMEFIAPTESGGYRSAWQAHNPEGVAFGDAFFVEIVVEKQSA